MFIPLRSTATNIKKIKIDIFPLIYFDLQDQLSTKGLVISLLIFSFCLLSISVFKVRYLSILLILEIFMLGILYSACNFSIGQYGIVGILSFFLFIVCMRGLGISIFISLFRSLSTDFFMNVFIF